MTSWSVWLPGQPPSGNNMYERNAGNLGVHKKPGVENYQATATLIVRSARPSLWKPEDEIWVGFAYQLARSVDVTNAQKVVEDAVAEALCPGIDPPRCCRRFDERFRPWTASVRFDKVEPGVWVYVGLHWFFHRPGIE